MSKRTNHIPLNPILHAFFDGIHLGTASTEELKELNLELEAKNKGIAQPHRDDHHFFIVLEHGEACIEVDFVRYILQQGTIIYIHPGQVHHLLSFHQASIRFLVIDTEHIQENYLSVLQDHIPFVPLQVESQDELLLVETLRLCTQFVEHKNEKFYFSFLKNGCNAFIGLVLSIYFKEIKQEIKSSRYEIVTKSFKARLEEQFEKHKSPTYYAEQQNLSVAYLNECVKNATGHPVSYHIQQRIVLQAKRMLRYSNQTVKEIAFALGYEDYPYFTRLFKKVAGVSAVAFRNENSE